VPSVARDLRRATRGRTGAHAGDILVGDLAALPRADVVVATPYFGWPPISGGWQRLVHTVRGLASAYRVVVVTQQGADEPIDAVAEAALGFMQDTGCVGFLAVSNRDREDLWEPTFADWPPVRALARDLVLRPLPLEARRYRAESFRRALAATRRVTDARIAWAFDPATPRTCAAPDSRPRSSTTTT
jgi:hypothetical protein